jgi:hypothetical protein
MTELKLTKLIQNQKLGQCTVYANPLPGKIPLCALVRAWRTSNATPHTKSQGDLSTVEQAKRRTDSKTLYARSLPTRSIAVARGERGRERGGRSGKMSDEDRDERGEE